MVIDTSRFSVGDTYAIDGSAFNVEVTDDTYAELAEMKLIYSFEKGYSDDAKSTAKLVDVRKLERASYVKWINLLASNKTCKIEFINNNVRRKIIGEAWILDGRYDSTVKKNMLENL